MNKTLNSMLSTNHVARHRGKWRYIGVGHRCSTQHNTHLFTVRRMGTLQWILQIFTYNFIRAKDAELQSFYFLQGSARVANRTRHLVATASDSELRRFPADYNLEQNYSSIPLIVNRIDSTWRLGGRAATAYFLWQVQQVQNEHLTAIPILLTTFASPNWTNRFVVGAVGLL